MTVPPSTWPPHYDEAYRPADDEPYWRRDFETEAPEQRDVRILHKVRAQVEWAYARSPFYRRKWHAAGVGPWTLEGLADLNLFPVVTKAELRADQAAEPPFGTYLCIAPDEVARIHGTSGTTGKPTVFAVGRDDWRRIAEAHARVLWAMGVRPRDTVFIGSFFSLYMGSWATLAGVERLGATAFPFGAGVQGQTLMAVRWMRETRPTAFYGTPSYALHLAEVARSEGIDPREFGLRILFFSGEPGAGIPATRRKIEEVFGGRCYDSGSMAEMTPWAHLGECSAGSGMHLWQDLVYAQVCDPESHQPLPFGAEGTPVYTHLERTSQPMIRLLSGDLTTWTDEPCACGRTYPRLPRGIYGRIDDQFTIRGENILPSSIEDVLLSLPGYGGEYRILVSRQESMDELVVQAELDPPTYTDPRAQRAFLDRVERELRTTLGVRASVQLKPPGGLPRTEFKARRVIDNRDLYRQAVG
ncbi:MAG: AMP-binding protein [Chloroflexi bacterium]|nr:AMP-binding protein [Chloroflexota bacterium]